MLAAPDRPAESFTDRWAPRVPAPGEEPPQAPVRVPQPDLLARYLGDDLSPLLSDAEARPGHYTTHQRETLERIRRGDSVDASARSELLLTYMRRTEAQALERGTRRKVTAQAVTPMRAPPPFENQGLFAGAIRII